VDAAAGFAKWRGSGSGGNFSRVQLFDGSGDSDTDSYSNP